jgi:Holliday junction resolvasome RuvABC endonuclease subunit
MEKKGSLIDIDRASILYSGLKSFVDLVMKKSGQKIFAFEVPGGSQSQRAAVCLGMAKGIIASVLCQEAFENRNEGSWMKAPVMPSEVHKKVTGKVKASKDDIMSYVVSNYPEQIKFENKRFAISNYFRDGSSTIDRYTKGDFEHVADAIVIGEIAFDKWRNK